MDIFENFENMEISLRPHAVYKTGGRNKESYAVTIPKPFAKEMGIAGKKKAWVRISLVKENNGSGTKNKKDPYLIIEKLEL